jgi:hypothetical protein
LPLGSLSASTNLRNGPCAWTQQKPGPKTGLNVLLLNDADVNY